MDNFKRFLVLFHIAYMPTPPSKLDSVETLPHHPKPKAGLSSTSQADLVIFLQQSPEHPAWL